MSEKRKARVLTLRGSRWARGGKHGDSGLLNTRGCSCCLGVDALSRGLPPDLLRNQEAPYDLATEEGPLVDAFVEDWRRNGGDDVLSCMLINDESEGVVLELDGADVRVESDAHRVDLLRPYFRNLPSGPVILRFRPDL